MRDAALWSDSVLKLKEPSPSSPPSATTKANRDEGNLEPRRMHDSYAELVLPFGSSAETLERYINASGGIRTGK
jgi:acyl-coenzyme A thioesterase 9